MPDSDRPSFLEFAADVRTGLSHDQKCLPSKYFYDEHGSRLFQSIMRMPEYYPTNCEYEIFSQQKEDILRILAERGEFDLVEFGAGDGMKTKVLLSHFVEQGKDFRYMPVDISREALDILTSSLAEELPKVEVQPLHAEYFSALEALGTKSGRRKAVLFLGSNIGNFRDDRALAFLQGIRQRLSMGDIFIAGFDLKKDPHIVRRAYDDPHGITREFNLNLLKRINRELGGEFDLNNFEHYAMYDPDSGEARSYLYSTKEQEVPIRKLEASFHFDRYEMIHTEISRKYSLDQIESYAGQCGFALRENLLDCKHWFCDSVWEAV